MIRMILKTSITVIALDRSRTSSRQGYLCFAAGFHSFGGYVTVHVALIPVTIPHIPHGFGTVRVDVAHSMSSTSRRHL